MFNQLTSLGFGIVVFAITIGVGTVVLTKFGQSQLGCSNWNTPVDTYVQNGSDITSCYNGSGGSVVRPAYDPTGMNRTVGYLNAQMGSTGGGLVTWTPALIALAVGMLFLGAFMIGKGNKKQY